MLQIADMINTNGFRTHRENVFENRTIQYILNNQSIADMYAGHQAEEYAEIVIINNSLVSKGTHLQ